MKFRPIQFSILVFALGCFVLLRAVELRQREIVEPHPIPQTQQIAAETQSSGLGIAPPFSLESSTGALVTEAAFRDTVWTINFFFTSCKSVCPVVSPELARLQQEFATEPNVKFLSVTVDPDFDTTARLDEYAKRYGADPEKWIIARGETKEKVIELGDRGFRLGLDQDPMLHSASFALMNQKGEIQGYFRGTEPESMEKLRNQIRELVRQKSE